MKKILSLILAILMIVSTVPMAFAVEFDKNAYTKALIDAYSAVYHVYASDEDSTSFEKTAANIFYLGVVEQEVFNMYPGLQSATLDTDTLATMPEAANAYTVALKEAAKNLPAQSTPIQINSRELIEAMFGTKLEYGENKVSALSEKVSAELTEKATNSTVNAITMLVSKESHTYTQADFNAAAKDAITYYAQMDNCLSGKHNIEADIVTDNGDGTHTFTCVFCSELVTVEHSYTNGKCICGINEPAIDDEKDDVTDDKTEDKTDNTQEPEKTNFIKKLVQEISNFVKELIEKIRNLFKR